MAAAAARATAAALLRSAATKIASRASIAPPHARQFSRYARPGGYKKPPPPPVTPPPILDSTHVSRYARPGGYTQPPRPKPTTTTTKTTRTISSKDPPHHLHHLPTGGNPSISAAVTREPTLGRVDSDSTCAGAYLVIVGGFLFFGWAERKKERDAAAKKKADNERFDATMRDAYDEMVRVVGHDDQA